MRDNDPQILAAWLPAHSGVVCWSLAVLLVVCNNSCQASAQQQGKSIMSEEERITLEPGESRQITLQSRGAAGLQLMYEITDSNVVAVELKPADPGELERARTTNVGGAVIALFEIRALHEGQSETHCL